MRRWDRLQWHYAAWVVHASSCCSSCFVGVSLSCLQTFLLACLFWNKNTLHPHTDAKDTSTKKHKCARIHIHTGGGGPCARRRSLSVSSRVGGGQGISAAIPATHSRRAGGDVGGGDAAGGSCGWARLAHWWGWPELYIHTVYVRMYVIFRAQNTV